jgi:hypothetical protein
MVKFEQIDPTEIDNLRQGRRGRVSYPILKGFLETNYFLAKLDRTGVQQSMQSMTSSLGAYIRSHEMPIKLFQRSGDIYLMRLDIDENGDPIEDWLEKKDDDATGSPVAITSDEVAKRFKEEKGQTTK